MIKARLEAAFHTNTEMLLTFAFKLNWAIVSTRLFFFKYFISLQSLLLGLSLSLLHTAAWTK